MEATKIDFEALLQAIRTIRPEVETIAHIQSFRPSYRFFPAKLTLRGKNGESSDEVLKTAKEPESLQFEKDVLEALQEIGFPVPQVRSPIFEMAQNGEIFWGLFLQEVEGSPLEWLNLDNLHSADTTCKLTLQGVERLHHLTDKLLRHRISAALPKRFLADELEVIKSGAGPWLSESFFQRALGLIESIIPQIAVPLVFSNGDYNPLNFLAQNGEIVGWIDFEQACFEDPHIGFAKFLLWADDSFGWATGTRVGLVERYLFHNNIRPCDFYGRIVLRGLYYIHLRSVNEPPLYMIEIVKLYTEKLEDARSKGPRNRQSIDSPG